MDPPPPSSLSAPFGKAVASLFHFSHSFCARHLLSKQGCQFANSPHSYMIENRKPLSGADLFIFFKCTCLEKMAPWVFARLSRGRLQTWSKADLRPRQFYASGSFTPLLFLMCPVEGGRILYEPSELNQTKIYDGVLVPHKKIKKNLRLRD